MSAQPQLTAIAYDIVCDRRRQRVHNLLKLYGVSVQRSVFEARLTAPERASLLRRLGVLLDAAEDRLVLYPIPRDAEAGILSLGPDRPRPENPDYFIA